MKTLQTVATEMTAEIQARGELNRLAAKWRDRHALGHALAELETVSLFWALRNGFLSLV